MRGYKWQLINMKWAALFNVPLNAIGRWEEIHEASDVRSPPQHILIIDPFKETDCVGRAVWTGILSKSQVHNNDDAYRTQRIGLMQLIEPLNSTHTQEVVD